MRKIALGLSDKNLAFFLGRDHSASHFKGFQNEFQNCSICKFCITLVESRIAFCITFLELLVFKKMFCCSDYFDEKKRVVMKCYGFTINERLA